MWRVRTSDAALPGAPEASSDPDECAGSLDLSGSDAVFIPLMASPLDGGFSRSARRTNSSVSQPVTR